MNSTARKKTASQTLIAKPVCPTFVAEVSGLDFTKPFPPVLCEEVEALINQYGVLVFRGVQGMCNEKHIEFSALFGELDGVKDFVVPGVPYRLAPHYELFDAGNLAADGKTVLSPSDKRFKYSKVNLQWGVMKIDSRAIGCGTSMLLSTKGGTSIPSSRLMSSPTMEEILR